MKKIVYIDMDNTLADFESGVKTFTDEERAPFGVDENGKDHTDAEHFDVYILSTAPWGNPSAWTDKLNWVKTHLGEPARKRLILSHHKDLLRGDYIIDDSTKNGVAEFQGKHIQIGTEPYKDWPAVIDFFKGELKSLT